MRETRNRTDVERISFSPSDRCCVLPDGRTADLVRWFHMFGGAKKVAGARLHKDVSGRLAV